MRVSDKYRLLFVHVQKTGGNTVRGLLNESLPDARNPYAVLPKHARLGGILKAEPGLADYYIFGFVRNPWARMVSWWSMIQDAKSRADAGHPGAAERLRTNRFMRVVASSYETFDDFVLRGPDDMPRLGTAQVRYLSTPWRRADFIGHTENLRDDVAEVFDRLDLPLCEVPRANASTPRGPYQDFYTDATRAKVETVFADDVTAFGYTF
jgi:Sulfotransferase family